MSYLLLDTANFEEIEELIESRVIRGVTTNPSLISKEVKSDYFTKIEEIAQLLSCYPNHKKHLSIEVIADNPEDMYVQAHQFSEDLDFSDVDLFIKIPIMVGTLPIITRLEESGIKVNATACMTELQAKMAADAGASIVSFFYNRMKDGGNQEPYKTVATAARTIDSKIICGSIRKATDVTECWDAGAEYVTVSRKVIDEMIHHPQTSKAIMQFESDIKKWMSNNE